MNSLLKHNSILHAILPYLIVTCILLVIPIFLESPYVLGLLVLCNIYGVFLASWDFLTGYSGQFSLGHALFIGGGAYTAGLLNFYFKTPPFITIPLGGLVAATLGLVIGIPALRLRGPYLALATFAAAGIPTVLVSVFWKHTGGGDGLSGITSLALNPVRMYYLSVALLVFCCGVLLSIVKSQYGLILLSIKEDEMASMASGISTSKYKVAAFTLSGFFAGIAGAFYCHNQLHVGTEEFSLMLSFLVVMMTLIGGIGTIIGSVFGGYLLILLNEWLRFIEEFRMLIYSGAVVLILLFLPKGILPSILWVGKYLLSAYYEKKGIIRK